MLSPTAHSLDAGTCNKTVDSAGPFLILLVEIPTKLLPLAIILVLPLASVGPLGSGSQVNLLGGGGRCC